MLNLREAEAKQLARIEELGLKRLITHARFEEPRDVACFHKIIAITEVDLVDAEQWKNKKQGELVAHVGSGGSYCSHKDQFSKRQGRVIATARALKDYEKRR